MNEYTFIYRVKETDDRDCCAYVETKTPRFKGGNYFARVILHGACYSNSNFEDYDNIETILSKEDYEKLIKLDKELNHLGFGIVKDSDEYNKWVEICNEIQLIINKLLTSEAEEFYEDIKQDEDEWIKNEYNLSDNDLEKIWNTYYLDYHDRGCVGYVYEDLYELGENEFDCCYTLDDELKKYFDNENYVLLDNGRVVSLNY